jgi:hypothetical protein
MTTRRLACLTARRTPGRLLALLAAWGLAGLAGPVEQGASP